MAEHKLSWPANSALPRQGTIGAPVLPGLRTAGLRAALAAIAAGRDWRYPALTACLLLYFYPFLRVFTLPVDEGWCLTDAARVFRGELPFRDFFDIAGGPGAFYWIALFFSLFGENWLATRLCVLVGGMATALLVYFLARRLKPGSEIGVLVFWLAVSFPGWPSINHHLVANVFALAAFGLALTWLDNRRPGVLFICGVAAGLTASIIFQKGAILGLALVLTLWFQPKGARRFAPIVQFLSGAVSVVVGVLSYFWARGGLSDLIYTNFVWPLENYSQAGSVPYGYGLADNFRNLASGHLGGLAAASILAIPALVVVLLPLILAVLGLLSRSSSFNARTLPYWLAGFALWLSEVHRPDMIHLVSGSPILIILGFALIHEMRARAVAHARLIVSGAAAILASVTLLVCLMAGFPISTPVGSAASFGKNPVIDFTNSHVKPGDTIFVYPYAPIYYFLSGAVNPTRFSVLIYNYNTREQMLEVVGSLEKDQTRYVIWDTKFETVTARALLPSYRPPLSGDRVIEPYLTANYKEIGFENGFRFMERKRNEGAIGQ